MLKKFIAIKNVGRFFSSAMSGNPELAMRCNETIRKCMPHGVAEVEARCECGAEYLVRDDGPGKTFWEPKQIDVPCPKAGCGRTFALWPDEVKPGTAWTCPDCGQGWMIQLGIEARDLPQESSADEFQPTSAWPSSAEK